MALYGPIWPYIYLKWPYMALGTLKQGPGGTWRYPEYRVPGTSRRPPGTSEYRVPGTSRRPYGHSEARYRVLGTSWYPGYWYLPGYCTQGTLYLGTLSVLHSGSQCALVCALLARTVTAGGERRVPRALPTREVPIWPYMALYPIYGPIWPYMALYGPIPT